MNIEIKEIEPCKLDVSYSSNSDEINEKLNQVMDAFKKMPVSGFRKGKATRSAIKLKYKNQINNSLKNALLEEAYNNVIFEKGLKTLGKPQVTFVNLLKNTFECAMVLHVKPTFELQDYKNYEIPKPHESLTVEDLTEKMVQDLRLRYGEVIPYEEDDVVKDRDNVIVNYVGSIDGEKIDALSAEGEMLTVGVSKLTSFDEELIGMTVDETREFDVVVPEDGLPSFAGKKVHFSVTLVTGSRIVPAPLDDSLAQKIGKNSFQELRSMVSVAAAKRVVDVNKSNLLQSLSRKIVDDYAFEVPQWLVLPEARQLAHQSNADWETLKDIDKEKFMQDAKDNIKLSLILDSIREEDPDAQLSNDEIYETVRETLIQFSNGSVTEENVKEHMKSLMKSGQYQVIASQKLDEFTLNYILEISKIIE